MLTNLNPETIAAAIPAPDRATPPCPHFGPCGGCQLQHLTYPAQLALKAAQLHTLLDATGLALPELRLHASPPLAYRNRIRLTLAEVAGQLRAGYLTSPGPNQQPATNNQQPTFLPITECPIAAPILWRAAETLLELVNQRSATWLERAPFTLDQLELFTTPEDAPAEARLQISLFARTSAKTLPSRFRDELAALCESLRLHVSALVGAGIYLIPPRSARSRRVEQPRPGPTWGSPGLNYTVGTKDEVVILSAAQNPRVSSLPSPVPQPATINLQPATSYWVPRGAFFQVNRFLLPELLALVTSNRTGGLDRSRGDSQQGDDSSRGFLSRKTTLQSGSSEPLNRGTGLAWDLYAGVGLFTSALAPHFAHITAVEIAEPSFTALTSSKLPNRHTVKASTLDFLRAAVTQRDRPDLIVLDPPRTGAGPEVCALLAQIAAPTLIYVSCSPETLPADLTTLAASGYRVAELHLLDLFPQTTHIETVAILTRDSTFPAKRHADVVQS
jgi:23S rRNA (uracil1939-C5)-methyltransferase